IPHKLLENTKFSLSGFGFHPRFTWVFFLASKDETSAILRTFIIGIENLVDHKVKVIRCDNRTAFKNREMNQFYEKKEAVNTACYVHSRVLVVKPYNKTSYELFYGTTPTLSFMRPFGCYVTILNTKDHLGKFDGKADEEFFIGYSLNSKAFRVFNNRTRIVEKNLHIKFSKNTPNIVGSGLNWLFDIATLTKVNSVGANTNNELPFDLEMHALEDINTFNFSSDHEDDDEEADMNNMDTTIQDKYVAEIIKKYGFLEVKNASTPIETQKPLLKDEDREEVDVHMYRSMIGSLMYLTSSRPDIMFSVCACARYQVNPKVSHLHAVKRIFRCQEAIGDTIAQTRPERVSKVSNDPLLARVNTPRSGEDSLKINELMELCTNLQNKVLDLETTKTTQAMEIKSLKRRLQKLKKKQRLRTHKLKRLYKGMIADIDSSKDIYLVNVHKDKDIFGVNDSDSDEVIVKVAEMLFDVADDLRAEKAQQELKVNIALIESWDDVQAKIDADYELAQRLQAEK
nr:hypothetical protein [Tanacetum cinerariifolium]